MSTIWCIAHNHAIELCTKHLAGVKNVHADRISRRVSPYEWQLQLFRPLDKCGGPHTVDCFAVKVNTQFPRYNSFPGDPEAINALAQQNWVLENKYVNPPFRLLPRILDVICKQKARATIIDSVWKGQNGIKNDF